MLFKVLVCLLFLYLSYANIEVNMNGTVVIQAVYHAKAKHIDNIIGHCITISNNSSFECFYLSRLRYWVSIIDYLPLGFKGYIVNTTANLGSPMRALYNSHINFLSNTHVIEIMKLDSDKLYNFMLNTNETRINVSIAYTTYNPSNSNPIFVFTRGCLLTVNIIVTTLLMLSSVKIINEFYKNGTKSIKPSYTILIIILKNIWMLIIMFVDPMGVNTILDIYLIYLSIIVCAYLSGFCVLYHIVYTINMFTAKLTKEGFSNRSLRLLYSIITIILFTLISLIILARLANNITILNIVGIISSFILAIVYVSAAIGFIVSIQRLKSYIKNAKHKKSMNLRLRFVYPALIIGSIIMLSSMCFYIDSFISWWGISTHLATLTLGLGSYTFDSAIFVFHFDLMSLTQRSSHDSKTSKTSETNKSKNKEQSD